MKRRFLKSAKWLSFLFVALFGFRLLYGFVVVEAQNDDHTNDFFGSLDNLRKNYASEKFSKGEASGGSMQQISPATQGSSQKFEKVASVVTKTKDFDADSKAITAKTKAFHAVVQYEQNHGQRGYREIHLLIGVNPDQFDRFYSEIQKIGVVKATQITKIDKTNEYRQLNAKKTSLEKTLQSLNDLKSKGGAISDFVALNEKILEIEGRLQELGVELGNFDQENEFCTVKLSLHEGATERRISIMHRIRVALEWTLQYYLVAVLIAFVGSLTIFIVLLINDKLKLYVPPKNTPNS